MCGIPDVLHVDHGSDFTSHHLERTTVAQFALSLLGFNLGIELMQQLVVLPPLVVLTRTPLYKPFRIVAALITAAAATGWLLDRIGIPNLLGTAADDLGSATP